MLAVFEGGAAVVACDLGGCVVVVDSGGGSDCGCGVVGLGGDGGVDAFVVTVCWLWWLLLQILL